ncbi:MAG: SLC13 family permease [Planctomycetota bacterium]
MLPLLAEAEHAVSMGTTLLFAGVLVALIACLALEEKIHAKKSVIVAWFAVISLILGAIYHLLPFGKVTVPGGHEISMPVYIPGIDWGVIAIILGSSIFVDVTSKSGLFTWIAIKLTKLSRGDPLLLLIFYGVMTVIFSAVLNNVTAMIIVGSLTGVSLERLGKKEKLLSFLLIEGLLTNIGGLLTLISSVPNIIVGTAAKISFLQFFLTACPYVVIATAVTLLMGAKLAGVSRLQSDEEQLEAERLVASFDENDSIESKGFFWFGSIMTFLFVVVIAAASELPVVNGDELGLGFVALGFGAIMLTRYKSVANRFYQAVDWDLLAFFAGLFVVINVMEHAQVLALIGKGLAYIVDLPAWAGSSSLLAASAAFSSVTDNIPLAAMLAKILSGIPEVTLADHPDGLSSLWWAVCFGANLGGNLTPIGSASTLVAVTIIHKNEIPLSFGGFVKQAFPYAVAHIAIAIAYVLCLEFFF